MLAVDVLQGQVEGAQLAAASLEGLADVPSYELDLGNVVDDGRPLILDALGTVIVPLELEIGLPPRLLFELMHFDECATDVDGGLQ